VPAVSVYLGRIERCIGPHGQEAQGAVLELDLEFCNCAEAWRTGGLALSFHRIVKGPGILPVQWFVPRDGALFWGSDLGFNVCSLSSLTGKQALMCEERDTWNDGCSVETMRCNISHVVLFPCNHHATVRDLALVSLSIAARP
jgi:hypothetical protein